MNRILSLPVVFVAIGGAAVHAADLPWEQYPEGEGRTQAYSICSACHSFELVAQQGMSFDRWDETLEWMTDKQGMVELPGELRSLILAYLAGAFPQEVPRHPDVPVGSTLESLPDSEGRSETFAFCSACHSMRLVAQQGLDRDGWEEVLDWMTEEQGMVELPAEMRERVLVYLSSAFPVER